ncbi:MAG: CNNM domain-containing protein, partial [bacterium]
MDGGSSWKFILLFICVVFSALFSSSETSLMSISKIRIRYMLDNKVRGAKLLYTLLEKPNKLLGTILVGNNIVNIAASAIATSLAIDYFGDKGVGIATIVMTLLILIFSEITPKSYAAHNSEKVAIRVSKIIYLSMLILTPITKIINLLTSYLLRLIGMKGDKKRSFTEEELKTIINVSHEEGILESREREMIHNVFEFTDVYVKDVM